MAAFQYDKITLGEDERCVISLDCHQTQLNNNILVVGGSGSGKTMGIVNPLLFNVQNTNLVGVFTKKGVTDIAKKHLEKKGYRVYTLDFTNPKKSKYGYDPLAYCSNSADVRALAHAVVYGNKKEPRSEDRFWDDFAENLIYIITNHVFNGNYEGGRRMSDAVKLILDVKQHYDFDRIEDMVKTDEEEEEEEQECHDNITPKSNVARKKDYEERRRRGQTTREEDLAELKAEYPLHYTLRNLKKEDSWAFKVWANFNNGAEPTSASIAQTTMTPVAAVFNEAVIRLMEKGNSFDFRELTKPKTALFVYTSPVNPAFDGIVAIFYQQLFKCLFEFAEGLDSGELAYPVQVICDDFATGAKVPEFSRLISIFREKKMAATILVQSLSQLNSLYGRNDGVTIINNCDTLVYMGGMDIKSSQYVAERLNMPNECIYDMKIGEECFIRRGESAFMTKRYDFLNDPSYNEAKRNYMKENRLGR